MGFWTHLLNFTFSIRYLLRVHEGVEYPLQDKPERMRKRGFARKRPINTTPNGPAVRKSVSGKDHFTWESLMPGLPQGNRIPLDLFLDVHEEAALGFEGKDIKRVFLKTSVSYQTDIRC